MNSKPSAETSHSHDEGVDTETQPSNNEGQGRRSFIMSVLGVLLVAGGIAAFLFLSSDSDPPAKPSGPARGLACPHLRQAADAYEQDDRAAFDQAIARAAQVAEQTLQTSGQVFGEPERIALELNLAPEKNATRVKRLLDLGARECQDLDSA